MDSERSDGTRALHRIADALDARSDDLFATNDGTGASTYPTAIEASALLMVFVRVASPQARRRIISVVEAEARRDRLDPRHSH